MTFRLGHQELFKSKRVYTAIKGVNDDHRQMTRGCREIVVFRCVGCIQYLRPQARRTYVPIKPCITFNFYRVFVISHTSLLIPCIECSKLWLYENQHPWETYYMVVACFGVARSTLQDRHTGIHAPCALHLTERCVSTTNLALTTLNFAEHPKPATLVSDRMHNVSMLSTSLPDKVLNQPQGHNWRLALSHHDHPTIVSNQSPQTSQVNSESTTVTTFPRIWYTTSYRQDVQGWTMENEVRRA